MPIDLNLLRTDRGGDPAKVRKSEVDRYRDTKFIDELIAADEKWRKMKYSLDTKKYEVGKISKAVAEKKKASKGKDPCDEERAQAKVMNEEIEVIKVEVAEAEKKVNDLQGKIGNILSPNVPIFKDEKDNQVIDTWGEPKKIDIDGKTLGRMHHHEIMHCLDIADLERGSKISGHRGYFLKGMGVLLNQALINYGIQFLHKKEYTPLQPPYFMKSSIMEETCQLSDFEENLYKVIKDEEEPLYLIATSEQPISGMMRKEWIEPKDLPLRFAGTSSCFRKEAGSHGKDVWGIFRVHQFEKIEQFIYCDPNKSWEEFERMVGSSKEFLKSLGLPFQVINIVSGALNDAAAQKYDVEAWFPGYGEFRELVSCSNCTDYQARALEVRYHLKNTDEKLYCHMLNGTLCATERTLCCILENYQTEEGLVVPEVLRPFMGGVDFIPYKPEAVKDLRDKQAKAELAEKKAAEAAKKKGAKGGDKKDAKKADGEKKQEAKKEEPKKEQAKKTDEAQADTKTNNKVKIVENLEFNVMTQMVKAIANHSKVDYEVKKIAQAEREQYAKTAISTNLPKMELADGTIISESTAIARYLAKNREGFWGKNLFEEAQVDQWASIATKDIHNKTVQYFPKTIWQVPIPQAAFDNAVKQQEQELININKYLKGRDWLVGDSFTAADLILAFMIILPLTYQFGLEFRQKQAPHLAAWFDKVSRLPAFISVAGYVKLCTVPIAPVGATQQEPLTQEQIDELMDLEAEDAEEQEEPKKEAKKDDDDLDLFGSDDEDDAAAAEALKKKAAEAKAKKDKPKKVVIAKSLVLFEVKPYEAETKMADMAAEILKIEMDGLWWKTEWKTEPIAYGVEKLIIGCTVEDEKVSVDDLQEKIEGLEDLVQSVEIIGFNKI